MLVTPSLTDQSHHTGFPLATIWPEVSELEFCAVMLESLHSSRQQLISPLEHAQVAPKHPSLYPVEQYKHTIPGADLHAVQQLLDWLR